MSVVDVAGKKQFRPRAPRVKLTLTNDLIQDAVERSSGHCMWAEAVKAQVEGASEVSVDLQTIRWTDKSKGLRYVYLTPRRAQVSLVKFDQGIRDGWAEATIQLRNAQIIKTHPKRPAEITQSSRRTPTMPEGQRTELVQRHGESKLSVPDKIGGTAPPRAALSHSRGMRRSFGLRALEL